MYATHIHLIESKMFRIISEKREVQDACCVDCLKMYPGWCLLLAGLVWQLFHSLAEQVLFLAFISILLGRKAALVHPFHSLIAEPVHVVRMLH